MQKAKKLAKKWQGGQKMKKKSLIKNEKAQVLGLPMYLIIIMIVAIAVIAAVLFMMPRGTKQMSAVVTEYYLISEEADDMAELEFGSYTVEVKVTSNDENADPIYGAYVTLTGAGASGSDDTNEQGIAEIEVSPVLGDNEKDAYMKLEVRASGYEDKVIEKAVHVHREI